jgi:hypothetical protein
MDFFDAIHPRDRERDSALRRNATADVTVPGATRRNGNPAFMGELQRLADMLGRSSKDDHIRFPAREPSIGGMFCENVAFC